MLVYHLTRYLNPSYFFAKWIKNMLQNQYYRCESNDVCTYERDQLHFILANVNSITNIISYLYYVEVGIQRFLDLLHMYK